MCDDIDCDKVNVHTGRDDKTTNAFRSAVLKSCRGCSAITLGHDIYFRASDEETDAVDMSTLAHEMTHVGQYEDWGALGYAVGGALTQFFNMFQSQYQVGLPMRKNWTQYGMEQQATIVGRCYGKVPGYCANSPYSFPGSR